MSFTIKDLESLSGIKAHTIRIWEQRYALLKPSRTATNIRYYDGNELKNLLNISLLNKYGYKISNITNFTKEQVKEKILQLNNAEAQVQRTLNELIQTMIDFDVNQFEYLLNQHIAAIGIEKTIKQIIFPFLQRVGLLWQTHSINPVQEHLITNIIRQKFILAIENVKPFKITNSLVILFTPAEEYHELGLLYVHYQLKLRGINVLYLGCNVPIEELKSLISVKTPNYIYTHITSIQQGTRFNKFMDLCKINIPNAIPLIISGTTIQQYKGELPQNVQVKRSIEEVNCFLNEI